MAGMVLHINMHQLMGSDFQSDVTLSRWWPWCHFMQEHAPTSWVNTKCPQTQWLSSSINSSRSILHLYILLASFAVS